MERGTLRLLIGALAPLALTIGCSASPEGTAGPKATEGVGQAKEALLLIPPTCSNTGSHHDVVANLRSDGSGLYWKSFPISGETGAILTYEDEVWSNLARSNGYAYDVLDFDQENRTMQYFVLVGIRESTAVPPYLMSPPTAPVEPGAYAATANDYTTEIVQSGANTAPPVSAQSYNCVRVFSGSGVLLDYFPLADEHDPTTHPW